MLDWVVVQIPSILLVQIPSILLVQIPSILLGVSRLARALRDTLRVQSQDYAEGDVSGLFTAHGPVSRVRIITSKAEREVRHLRTDIPRPHAQSSAPV